MNQQTNSRVKYDGEDVWVKENAYDISLVSIKKLLEERGIRVRACQDRSTVPLAEIFNGQVPKVIFLGHYPGIHHLSGGHSPLNFDTNSIASAIRDIEFMKKQYPRTALVTIASPQTYERHFKKRNIPNICRRTHANLELAIADLSFAALKSV